MAIKFKNEVKTRILNRPAFEVTEQLNKRIWESFASNVEANLESTGKSTVAEGSLDAFLMEEPEIRNAFNKRLLKKTKTQVKYEGLEGTPDENNSNQRILTTTNSDCQVVSCSDIMIEMYECEKDLIDYINVRNTGSTCSTQFASYIGRGEAPEVLEGALYPDVSDYFATDKPAVGDKYMSCKTLTPKEYGVRVPITNKRLNCNSCINILDFVTTELPRMVKRGVSAAIFADITATATLLPTSSTNILNILTEAEKAAVVNRLSLGQIVHLMNPAVFIEFYNKLDANNRPLIEMQLGQCPLPECGMICIGLHRIIVTERVPIAGPAGARTSQIITCDLNLIAANSSDLKTCESPLNGNCYQGIEIAAGQDFISGIPTNMVSKFFKTNVVV